jgi:DNA-binding CsgD family transcriptional regulator
MMLVYAGLGLPEHALEEAQRARDAYRRLGNHSVALMVSCVLVRLVLSPYFADRPALRRDALAEMADDFTRAAGGGIVPPESVPLMSELLDSDIAALEGDWEAKRRAATALMASGHTNIFVLLMTAAVGEIARSQGDTDAAWQMVRPLFTQGAQTEPGELPIHLTLPFQRLAPALALDAGDLPAAHAWLEAYDRWLAWSGAALGRSEGEALWAQYHRQAGDRDDAYQHAERALAHATEPRQPLALLTAHRLLGELDTDAGRFEGADAHVREALTLADACEVPYERALTLLARAELRAAQGEYGDARRVLDATRGTLESLGATPALARADAIAGRLPSPSGTARSHPDGLTHREIEVLRLIAAGSSNREIAATLFISERTVNRHITNLYGKIGARGRADATAYALRHGLA